MTPKAYLNQAYRLEQRIRLHKEEIDNLEALAGSVGSPGFDEHYNPNKATEAPFIKTLEKIWDYEERVNQRLVLTYRYITNFTWGQIGEELYADERTIRRWHNRALAHVVVPKEPTVI